MSSDLWYPGRIPLCTPQVVRGLDSYIEALQTAIVRQDTTYIEVANRIHQDIYATLFEEGRSCLGSDTDINSLLTLLMRSQQAAVLCAQRNCWEDLEDVINAIEVVRWSLALKQEKGGTDDGEEPGAVATPDPDGGTARRSDRAPDPGQTDWTDYPDADFFKAQAEIPSCDEENEDNDDLARDEEESLPLGP